MNEVIKKFIIFPLVLSLLGIGIPPLARAELVGTQQLVQAQERQTRLDRINVLLARDVVRDRFIELGVAPAQAQERIAALTDEELVMLEQRLESLPAGGVLAIIGAVFLVLLILELVGITNVFTRL